jgi:hypothetical protein
MVATIHHSTNDLNNAYIHIINIAVTLTSMTHHSLSHTHNHFDIIDNTFSTIIYFCITKGCMYLIQKI